jgi:hypothetical protein
MIGEARAEFSKAFAADLLKAGTHMLLGRDLLQHAHMSYDGVSVRVELRFA